VFREQLWETLLDWIEGRTVVPVVGPELILLEIDGEKIPLSRFLAREVGRRLQVDVRQLSPGFGLDEVASLYLRQPGSYPQDLYEEAGDVMARAHWPSPEPLKKLAAITHFDLYVSTTFDSLLEQTLNEVRFGCARRTRSFAYRCKENPDDVPSDYIPEQSPVAPSEPAVYHLFGKLNNLNDYVLREEDALQFCHRLISRDRQSLEVFERLRTSRILALGCGFPGWLTRFFLAGAKGKEFFTDGARGVVADSTTPKDLSLVYFLERRRADVYEGDGIAFVDQLLERWTKRFRADGGSGAGPVAPIVDLPEFKPQSAFISYASEDRAEAMLIRDALERAGIDVWFDQKRLESGDLYEAKIFRNIEICSVFLPVISRNAVATSRRFLFKEWKKALHEAEAFAEDDPFIRPVVIDDTPIDAPHIPAGFSGRHWLRAPDGRVPDEFVLSIRRQIRGLRRKGAVA
jgi:hypothetical protein